MPMNELAVKARIKKGIAWLDKHHPKWLFKYNLDLARLSMASNDDCILGQITGDFEATIRQVWEDDKGQEKARIRKFIYSENLTFRDETWSEECGFWARQEDYPLMEELWRKAVLRLRKERFNERGHLKAKPKE
jgi:hypothetical protein